MKDLARLIIDVQKAIDHPKWGTRNNLHMEDNIARLLDVWRHSEPTNGMLKPGVTKDSRMTSVSVLTAIR